MNFTINMEELKIPNGHEKSFRRGFADGLLDEYLHLEEPHNTHNASYKKGFDLGLEVTKEIAKQQDIIHKRKKGGE